MNNNEKNYKRLRNSLNSSDPLEKTAIITKLRDETPFKGVIFIIKEILETDSDPSVLEASEKFLNDLKYQALCAELIEAIEATEDEIVIQKLTASCWQSGLDYSEHLHHFINWSITKSYLVTLECYSVIEQWVHKADPIKRSSWKVQLKNAQSDMDTDRNKLVEAIIDLL